MKLVSALTLVLFAVVILVVLLVVSPITPANATEPTATPMVTPALNPSGTHSDLLCLLERGLNCDIINPLDLAISASKLRTNPILNARDVPTYTLVSVTFDREIDSKTITEDTFYVNRDSARVEGRIDYIDIGRMAIFYPDNPLEPNTAYTATVTLGVRDLSGVPPFPEDLVWTFTTAPVEQVQLNLDLPTTNASPPGSGMNIYFGDLHSHTGYSDGKGTPSDAFTMARANGLHFYAVTEHGFMLDAGEWQTVLNQANTATDNGQFVALPGFEYTHAKGHINVFGSDTYIHRNDPAYNTLAEFYTWLINHPTAIGQFNHPTNANDFNFSDFSFNAAADQKMVLQELLTADQFFLSLDSGWHLGTLKNRDTHNPDWGCCPLMGLLAPNLTKNSILEALKSRRTFFVSPDDSNLALVMRANGSWMGSAIPNTATVNFKITAHDPDPKGKPLRLKLYDNGFPVASITLPSAVWYNWSPTVSGALGHYYYAEAYYDDWFYAAYSSPIWVERSPIADANTVQYVAPGALVTLDGTKSWDPDGDVLAYQWSQDSGPAVSLNGTNSAKPTFIAPATLTNLGFQLTVVDTGSLSDADMTTVTVTDKPILSISKSGPTTAEPGDLINYTLTVTNHGINNAVGVVITDAVPAGASYVGGGTLLPGNIVSWTIPSLAANGGTGQVMFAVTATGGIINNDYRASCAGCISAIGNVAVSTNSQLIHLPAIHKNN